jgi:predicted phosphate transport protein (TIGR00153 family)
MARLTLTPQKREFFGLYNRAAENLVAIADKLVELLDRFPDGVEALGRSVKELEHEGDSLTHDLVDMLNRTFVTPFDRDDMYRLAGALDDVCDHVDEAASRIASYGVTEIRLPAKEQARTIRRSAGKLADAVALLEGFQDSRAHLAELRELEHVADQILHDSIATLFLARADDPLEVIRWKDIHESLEAAMNACERAANVLEAIVVKNR